MAHMLYHVTFAYYTSHSADGPSGCSVVCGVSCYQLPFLSASCSVSLHQGPLQLRWAGFTALRRQCDSHDYPLSFPVMTGQLRHFSRENEREKCALAFDTFPTDVKADKLYSLVFLKKCINRYCGYSQQKRTCVMCAWVSNKHSPTFSRKMYHILPHFRLKCFVRVK